MSSDFRVAWSSSKLSAWRDEVASERIRELCMSFKVKKASHSFSKYQIFLNLFFHTCTSICVTLKMKLSFVHFREWPGKGLIQCVIGGDCLELPLPEGCPEVPPALSSWVQVLWQPGPTAGGLPGLGAAAAGLEMPCSITLPLPRAMAQQLMGEPKLLNPSFPSSLKLPALQKVLSLV